MSGAAKFYAQLCGSSLQPIRLGQYRHTCRVWVNPNATHSLAGAWSEGLQHGHGRCQWADGALYEGAWEKGARCGAGRLTTPGGQELVGAWQADAMHGPGFCRTDAGDRYE